MYIFPAIILISSASAMAATSARQHLSRMALTGIFERQLAMCSSVPVPVTCEKSCGPGYITCINPSTCYNPSIGESCCSNGEYCPAGSYCTNAGCCPNAYSLAECGATSTLSTISPPESTSPVSTSPVSTSPTSTPLMSTSPTSTPSASSPSTSAPSTSTPPTSTLPSAGPSSSSATVPLFTGGANTHAVHSFALPLALVGVIVGL